MDRALRYPPAVRSAYIQYLIDNELSFHSTPHYSVYASLALIIQAPSPNVNEYPVKSVRHFLRVRNGETCLLVCTRIYVILAVFRCRKNALSGTLEHSSVIQ